MVTLDQISTFFNIYRHKSVVLTQFHLISSSTKLHWPSTTKYQPVPPHTDPVSPRTNQYCPLLTQFHHVSTSIALFWPSTSKYQPVPLNSDPVPSTTKQNHLVLTKYHRIYYTALNQKIWHFLEEELFTNSFSKFNGHTFVYQPEMSTVAR